MLPGKIRVNTPVCPDASPLQCPDPEQLFPITRWQDVPIPKAGAAAPSSSCTPSSPTAQYPEQFFGILPISLLETPISRLSRTFPDDKRPTAPAKRSDHSAGVSLSAVTGICSASMGISAGVTSFMRFLARSINSCSCSTI